MDGRITINRHGMDRCATISRYVSSMDGLVTISRYVSSMEGHVTISI